MPSLLERIENAVGALWRDDPAREEYRVLVESVAVGGDVNADEVAAALHELGRDAALFARDVAVLTRAAELQKVVAAKAGLLAADKKATAESVAYAEAHPECMFRADPERARLVAAVWATLPKLLRVKAAEDEQHDLRLAHPELFGD